MSVGVQRLRELTEADADLIAVKRETVLALLDVVEAAQAAWNATEIMAERPIVAFAQMLPLRDALARLEET